MMSRVQKGFVAGVFAMAVIAALEAVNILALKWFAPFPLIVSNLLGLGRNLTAGWAIHLAVGVLILGPLFGYLYQRLPTSTPEAKGIAFAVGAFVVMLLGFIVLGDGGTMGRNFGTLGWMLAVNAIFGIVMGNVYGRLEARERRARRMAEGVLAH